MSKRVTRTFTIGKDFSEAEIELLIMKLAKWFTSDKCDRRSENPEQDAKEIVYQCLNGLTKAGEPWKNAPAEFANRIKIKAAYNMETGEGIAIAAAKHPDAVRKLEAGIQENLGKLNDMSAIEPFDIGAYRAEQEVQILEAYPDLDSPALLPHVRRLTLLYAQQEVLDRELLITNNTNKRRDLLATIETLNKTLDSVLKILDIHPESIRKKIKESADGSLGDLVAILDSDDEFRVREKMWSLQTALQLWAATTRRNGRGDGPQLTAWELWHMTRTAPFSFTCKCGIHYPQLVAGFTPKQLKDYLKANGVLVERPVLGTLIKEEEVQGLEAYIESLPECLEPVDTIVTTDE